MGGLTWWFTTIIPATQKAEIRRITVQGQPRKKVSETPMSTKQADAGRWVAHAYNPSYSGVTDQEDQGSKPAQANSLRDPISKIPITKRNDGVAQGEGPEFKPQYHTHKHTHKTSWEW
jgi:hypothetical protein